MRSTNDTNQTDTIDEPTDEPDETSANESNRECQQCGRDRPVNPRRFTVTASDFTPGAADYTQAHLCYECWRGWIDDLRRCTS